MNKERVLIEKMHAVRMPVAQMRWEPASSSGLKRWSHPVYTRKMPKGITFCAYDIEEKTIQVEYSAGNRICMRLEDFFGIVIAEAKWISVIQKSGGEDEVIIERIETFKVKRTHYWKLIFGEDLPF